MAKVAVKGTLEIDIDRGVIYFHCSPQKELTAPTLLRICGLKFPKHYDHREHLLDITIEFGNKVSYGI